MLSREDVGRVVRETWEAWAREQPDVAEHPSWLVPWESLPERDREVDMRIGDAVVSAVYPKLRADVERLTRELREARAAIRDDGVRCRQCNRVAIGEAWEFDPRCAEHLPAALADEGFPYAMEWENATAIRAAEGET